MKTILQRIEQIAINEGIKITTFEKVLVQVREYYPGLLITEPIFNQNGFSLLLKIIPDIRKHGSLLAVALC